jgi:hypothetical protein
VLQCGISIKPKSPWDQRRRNGPDRNISASTLMSGRSSGHALTSAWCQEETRAGAATNGHKVARLLDHFIGEREQIVRDREAERLGSLEIYHKVESSGLLHGQVGGLRAL